jgi:hypothetical protein
MQAELNKYFPTVISNLILEKHYKSMFSQSIIKMKKGSEDCRIHYYESSDSEEDTDDEDDEENEQSRENSFVLQFRCCLLFEPKAKFRKWKHAKAIKKERQRKNERFEELMKGDLYHWVIPEYRSDVIRSAINAGFF